MFGFGKDQSILEVGCGDGLNLAILKQWGYKAVGVDMSGFLVERARAWGVAAVVGRAEKLPVAAASFGVVLLDSVVYRIGKRAVVWREIRRVLAKDGVVAIIEARMSLWRWMMDRLTLWGLPGFGNRRRAYLAEKGVLEAWLRIEPKFWARLERAGFKKVWQKRDWLSVVSLYRKID